MSAALAYFIVARHSPSWFFLPLTLTLQWDTPASQCTAPGVFPWPAPPGQLDRGCLIEKLRDEIAALKLLRAADGTAIRSQQPKPDTLYVPSYIINEACELARFLRRLQVHHVCRITW